MSDTLAEAHGSGSGCLQPEDVAALLQADASLGEGVHEHLAQCAGCREWVSELARTSWLDTRRPRDGACTAPPEGERYVPLVELGAGSMGTVWAAYDAMLDREVALKVLDDLGPYDETAVQKIRREARTLAALSHPNVVEVLDVRLHGECPAIAMSLVEGPTLGEWLAMARRTWVEILRSFEQAARGLAAAHAAGVVHCDFKPSNAIVGTDGRVRVLDFGLALGADSEESQQRWAGTPAYMAPEQRSGAAATALSDQFSWCVAAYEALFGGRPGHSIAPGSRGAADEVPRGVRRVLERGLRVDPARRWPTMEDLLQALRRSPTRWRRFGAGAAMLVALGIGGLSTAPRDPCKSAEEIQAQLWGPLTRTRTQAAMAGLGAPQRARVDEVLGTRALQWAQAQTELCQAARRPDPSPQSDRRQCLDRHAEHLRLTAEALAAGVDPQGATTLVERVSPATRCLLAPQRPELATAEQIALDHTVLGIQVHTHAGDHEAALALAESLRARVERHAGPVLWSRYAYAYGAAVLGAGRDGTAWFEQAARFGANGGDLEIGARAAMQLAGGYSPATSVDETRSELWLARAESLVETQGLVQLRPELARARGGAASLLGHYDEAVSAQRESVALLRQDPAEPVALAHGLADLGEALRQAGDLVEAEEITTEAHDLLVRALGSEHPETARALQELAAVWRDSGRVAEARDAYAQCLEILESTLGPNHISIAVVATNLAGTHLRLDDATRAVELLQRVTAIESVQLSPGRATASTLHTLGNAHVMLGQLDEAQAAFSRGLEQLGSELRPEHPERAIFISSLASVALDRGDTSGAIALATESQALRRRAYGPDDPRLAFEDLVLAGASLQHGSPQRALEYAEHGRRLLVDDAMRPGWKAELSYFEARALAELGRFARAKAVAVEAAVRFEALGEEANGAETRAWAETL